MAKPNRRHEIKKNIKGKHPGHSSLTKPLTPREAHHQAASESRAEYAPTIRAAKGELHGSQARQKQIGEWFSGLQNQINQAAQATDASSAQANNALLAHAQAAAQAAQQAQGQIGQSNAATAALTGADPSLFKGVEAEGAAAAGQRALTSEMLAAPIVQAGASQAAYLRNTGINAGRESIQQRGLESKRRQKIKEDLTSLRKERAQKTVGNFGAIRKEEKDYSIQRRAFPIEKQKLAQEAAEGAADRAEKQSERAEHRSERGEDRAQQQRENRFKQRELNEDREKREEEAKHGGKTRSERNAAREGRHNAAVTAHNLYKAATNKPHTAAEWAAFTQLVAQEEEISPQEAQWAVNKLRQQVRQRQELNAPPAGR